MSSISFKPGGSGDGASLPFVSIDIPGDVTRSANSGANTADGGSRVGVAAPFVSGDIPDVTGASDAGARA
jgi:hypothetical protein